MIPKNIKREHIIKAIKEIDSAGVREGRDSRKFQLEYEGKFYPPKYLISLANKYVNGTELKSSEFSGGSESNKFLANLGFSIGGPGVSKKPVMQITKEKTEMRTPNAIHDERCPVCKETIEKLLEKIYGRAKRNPRFEAGTLPDDFKNTPYYEKLKEIYELLQNHRGFKEFVRSNILPNCDFFVPDPEFIIEFDESQHFSLPRKIALSHYPENLKLGFDRKRWMSLCEEINAKDNEPPFRDEQRAWYDTLRDFLPAIKGLKPTIRLFAQDFPWCSFDQNNASDVRKFENILRTGVSKFNIRIKEEPESFLARIILATDWKGDKEEARRVLEEVCNKWPRGQKVKFLITCGGFLEFEWPDSVSKKSIGDNKYPNREPLETLAREAKKCAEYVLREGLREKLSEFADYITLGIDSQKEKISTTKNYIGEPHVELVLLIDLRNNNYNKWTGKSYPTPAQEKGLVRIAELDKHFFELNDVGEVMILGCHDLTIFNPRSKNAKGWREKVNADFRVMAREKEPIIVLQHPHTTDSIMTWAAAWNGLREWLPYVKMFASAGRYYNSDGERSDLEEVLKKTKFGNAIDFIILAK